MRRYTLVAILSLVIALLVGCSSTVEAPAGGQDADLAQEAAAQNSPAEESAPAAADSAAPAEPTETTTGQPEDAATQEPEAEPTPTEEQPTAEPLPTATDGPQFNGEYEETFYRGLATAPITMIDYSDFL
jgi:outer membrane biosynthesis protein TonB